MKTFVGFIWDCFLKPLLVGLLVVGAVVGVIGSIAWFVSHHQFFSSCFVVLWVVWLIGAVVLN